jgi:peptidoglycan/LPS O-acetylase OafA/YrhL
MGRVIVTVVVVVVFAVLVALNIGFTTSVNLFGNRFDNVPVVSVAALSFATAGRNGDLPTGIGTSPSARRPSPTGRPAQNQRPSPHPSRTPLGKAAGKRS